MKTAEQFLKDKLKSRLLPGTKKKLHEWDNSIATEEIIQYMSEYAKQCIQEFVTNETGGEGCVNAWRIGNQVGVRVDQHLLDKYKEQL